LETTIRDDTIIIKTESQTQTIVQEAINEKIDLRLLKCDTDNVIIDSSDPVQTVLLAKVENTLNNAFLNVDASQNLKVTVANQNDISTLATEETQAEIKTQVDKLTFTNNKLKVIEEPLITTEPIYLDFNNNSASVIGDSPAGCWYNPSDDVEGWGYINEIVGGAQVYYYTNTGLVPNASEPNITLGSVSTGWCVASLNLITTTDNTWIMGIYTKPTGSGDDQIWYKSRKSYQVTSSFPLSKGVDYLFYWGDDPTTVHPELQHVEMALASTQGPADPSEIVQFMSLNIPSTVPQFQFVGRVKRAGYVRSGVSREVHFLNSNKILTELKLQQLKFNTLVENEGQGALFVNVENEIGVTGTFWQETQPISGTVGITGPVGVTGTFWQETQPVSGIVGVTGPVEVSGTVGITGPVEVSGTVGITGPVEVSGIVGITGPVGVTGTFWQETQPVSGTFWQETQPVSGTVGITGPVGVTGTFWQETQPVSGTFWQETQPVSGTVGITGPVGVTGTFWQETQPVSGTFWQETQPVSGTVGITGPVGVTGTFWQETQPVSGTVGITGPVGVTGTFWQETQPVSGTVGVTGPVEVSGTVGITGPVGVTGTFWQETQPVSGTVGVTGPVGVTGTFWQETQPISGTVGVTGPVEVSGTVGITGPVGVTGTFWQETQPVSGTVGVTGTFWQETQPISGTVGVTGPVEVSGTVGVTGPVGVTGTFWQETQPISGTVGVTGPVEVSGTVGVTGPVGVTGTFWQETQPVSGTVGVTGPVGVTGTFWQETQPISGTVGITGTVPISSGSPLDTHLYASSNGSSWHHVSSDANGQLNVHSKTQDGAGNDITSTSSTGTEIYTALDVKCRGTTTVAGGVNATLETGSGPLTSTVNDEINALDVQVQNIVNTNLRTSTGGLLTSTSGGTKNSLDVSIQNTSLSVKATQYGSYANVANNASILPSGVTSGINVADWSYFVGAYEDYNGATTGTISLEYSFDNITYYTLFNTQIFPSGSGTPRRANINKQDIPAVNWIRLRNGTSSTLSSVTLTLLGGSVS
jgi:hypothetical protein